jgi:hypothetical protein
MICKATFFVSLIALVAEVHGLGRAIVTNQCDWPIYLWSVGGSISKQHNITKDSSYSEVFHKDPNSGGIALKMTTVEGGLFLPNASQTVFGYNLDTDDKVWYDMSDIFGDAFAGRTMSIKPSDSNCEGITWGDGRQPAGSHVKTCSANTDLELTFCTGHCLPSWSEYSMAYLQYRIANIPITGPCGSKGAPNDTRICCTHCIGDHHCVAPPNPPA